MWILRILGGLVAVAVGIAMVMKTDVFLDFLGASDWAETKIGPGGTRLLYKLIGVAIIILGLMGATGTLGSFLIGTVGFLFKPPAR